jgi:hypothetical protein
MKVIGISGRKQAGKNTTANILNGLVLQKYGLAEDWNIGAEGDLNVLTHDTFGNLGWGGFDITRKDREFVEYAELNLWPYVKLYSFADSLKQMCVELFEIPHGCVWGTDDQKNTLQEHLLWENMLGVIVPQEANFLFNETSGGYNCVDMLTPSVTDEEFIKRKFEGILSFDDGLFLIHKPGPMTAREFMQFLGTDVMRKMYGPIWINSCIKRIQQEQSELAIIADIRFPNEAEAITKIGGDLWRLNRVPFSDDKHSSETALDDYPFKTVIDNADKSVDHLVESVKQLFRR